MEAPLRDISFQQCQKLIHVIVFAWSMMVDVGIAYTNLALFANEIQTAYTRIQQRIR